MADFSYDYVRKFYALYMSERREIAQWLSVERERPDETDAQYGSRTMLAAKFAGKLDELAERIDGYLTQRPR